MSRNTGRGQKRRRTDAGSSDDDAIGQSSAQSSNHGLPKSVEKAMNSFLETFMHSVIKPGGKAMKRRQNRTPGLPPTSRPADWTDDLEEVANEEWKRTKSGWDIAPGSVSSVYSKLYKFKTVMLPPGAALPGLAIKYAVCLRTNDQRQWESESTDPFVLKFIKAAQDGVAKKRAHAKARAAHFKTGAYMLMYSLSNVFAALEKVVKIPATVHKANKHDYYYVGLNDLDNLIYALDSMVDPETQLPNLSAEALRATALVTRPTQCLPRGKENALAYHAEVMLEEKRRIIQYDLAHNRATARPQNRQQSQARTLTQARTQPQGRHSPQPQRRPTIINVELLSPDTPSYRDDDDSGDSDDSDDSNTRADQFLNQETFNNSVDDDDDDEDGDGMIGLSQDDTDALGQNSLTQNTLDNILADVNQNSPTQDDDDGVDFHGSPPIFPEPSEENRDLPIRPTVDEHSRDKTPEIDA